MSTVVPQFDSLAESRAFFEAHPELNPAAKPEKNGTHNKPGYVKSPVFRGLRPVRADLFVQEQTDNEGDIVWALWGRGEPVLTYSIRTIDAEILNRLTAEELEQLAGRSPRAAAVTVEPYTFTHDLEHAPELTVVTPAEQLPDVREYEREKKRRQRELVTDAELEAEADAVEAERYSPPADHPWRGNPEQTLGPKEAAA